VHTLCGTSKLAEQTGRQSTIDSMFGSRRALTDCGESARRHEHSHQTPVINRTEQGMTTDPFRAQRRNDARGWTGGRQGSMHPTTARKGWTAGGYFDPRHDECEWPVLASCSAFFQRSGAANCTPLTLSRTAARQVNRTSPHIRMAGRRFSRYRPSSRQFRAIFSPLGTHGLASRTAHF
jgi:hypothetical protein